LCRKVESVGYKLGYSGESGLDFTRFQSNTLGASD
jgi:hypothetical protein